MSGWFTTQIVHTGRLPLFCFFVAFLASFAFIRVSVRMIRAQVRWWPGNISSGGTHVHHMVFGVIFMVIAGVAGIAAPAGSTGWRAGAAALFGIGTALVLDEFALILHLRDVYWTSAGRVSIDAVFIAAAITALLLLDVTPASVSHLAAFRRGPVRRRRDHAAEGQDMDRAVRAVPARAVLRGGAAARAAALAVGPAAIPAQARQARPGHSPGGTRP